MEASLSPQRIWAARAIAVAADVIQIVLVPLFFEGGLSVLDVVLDVAVAGVLTSLLGWNWAFLPAFVAELIPGFDLVPSWTLAVFLATRHQSVAETVPPNARVIDVEAVRKDR